MCVMAVGAEEIRGILLAEDGKEVGQATLISTTDKGGFLYVQQFYPQWLTPVRFESGVETLWPLCRIKFLC